MKRLSIATREPAVWSRHVRRQREEAALVVNERAPASGVVRLKADHATALAAQRLEQRRASAILDSLHTQMNASVKDGVLTFEYPG